MTYHVELQLAARTDAGLVRTHNEDAISFSSEHGLLILADGMGGYNAGEVASGMATANLKAVLEGPLQEHDWGGQASHSKFVQHLLIDSVRRINSAILDAARNEPQFSGMGTTLVVAVFHQDKLTIAHVGDSRAYRLRNGVLTQITRDHSVLQEQIDAGLVSAENARFSSNRNLITRAVGIDHGIEVEVHDHVTQADDIYLLCSDGLSDMLTVQEITGILGTYPGSLESACDTLIARANNNGGKDNTSVILVKVLANRRAAKGLSTRALGWINDVTVSRWRA